MIHLMFDTNIWIYIANSSIYDKDYGFFVLDRLETLFNEGKITIYVNEIISKEWKRNANNAKANITKLENLLNNPGQINGIQNIIGKDDDLEKVKNKYEETIRLKIEENKHHLSELIQFLRKCTPINVTQEVKNKVINLAIDKKAPFHNSKNNINDSLILFSFDEHIKTMQEFDYNDFYFVTNNKEDFLKGDKAEFHPEIKENLSSSKLKVCRNIQDVLKLIDETTKKFEEDKEKLGLGN